MIAVILAVLQLGVTFAFVAGVRTLGRLFRELRPAEVERQDAAEADDDEDDAEGDFYVPPAPTCDCKECAEKYEFVCTIFEHSVRGSTWSVMDAKRPKEKPRAFVTRWGDA